MWPAWSDIIAIRRNSAAPSPTTPATSRRLAVAPPRPPLPPLEPLETRAFLDIGTPEGWSTLSYMASHGRQTFRGVTAHPFREVGNRVRGKLRIFGHQPVAVWRVAGLYPEAAREPRRDERVLVAPDHLRLELRGEQLRIPALPHRRAHRAVVAKHVALRRRRELRERELDVVARHRLRAAPDLVDEQRPDRQLHRRLAEPPGAPHPAPEVPAIARAPDRVEDRQRGDALGMKRREREPVVAADVVDDDVHAIAPQRIGAAAHERGLRVEREVVIVRRGRLAEAGQVGREATELGQRGDRRVPYRVGIGIAVKEDRRGTRAGLGDMRVDRTELEVEMLRVRLWL